MKKIIFLAIISLSNLVHAEAILGCKTFGMLEGRKYARLVVEQAGNLSITKVELPLTNDSSCIGTAETFLGKSGWVKTKIQMNNGISVTTIHSKEFLELNDNERSRCKCEIEHVDEKRLTYLKDNGLLSE